MDDVFFGRGKPLPYGEVKHFRPVVGADIICLLFHTAKKKV